MLDAIVVGGGVSGLAVGAALTARNLTFQILEGSDCLGGNVRTLQHDGCVVDMGPDVLMGGTAKWTSLNLESPGPAAADLLLAREGKLHAMPRGLSFGIPTSLSSLLSTPLVSPLGKLRAGMDLFLPQSAATTSLGKRLRARLGREVLDSLVEPLVQAVYGDEADHLDIRVTMPHLANNKGSLVRALAAKSPKAKKGEVPTPNRSIQAPQRGMSELVRALGVAAGAEHITTRAHVANARTCEDGYVCHLTDGRVFKAKRLVIATPSRQAAEIVRHIDSSLADLLGAITCRASISVALAFDGPIVNLPLASGFVVAPSEDSALTAATFVHHKWPGHVRPGLLVIRASLRPESVDSNARDAEVSQKVLTELRRYLNLPEPRWSCVERFLDGAPVPEVGHPERVENLRRHVQTLPGLYLAGSAVDGPGISGCLLGAERLCQSIGEA